ncbi:MAG: radical SAM protein [Anaerolineae bacterium]|nr:radical SAM protein [Anaerolineae bacterium]
MELQQKLDLLGAGAGFDVDEAAQVSLCATAGKPLPNGRTPAELGRSISMLTRSDGKKVPILKVLQTSACAKDCYYCPFRAGRDFRRAAFTPEELARATDQLYRAGRIQGLFLSSGIVGKGEYSQERIVATAEILRRQYEFRGYLHLKLMPNASAAAVERSMQLADRVSVNLEAPTPAALDRRSGTKDLVSLLNPLRLAASLAPRRHRRRVSHVTQFVVGGGGTDRDLLRRTDELYRRRVVARVLQRVFTCAQYAPGRPGPHGPAPGGASVSGGLSHAALWL